MAKRKKRNVGLRAVLWLILIGVVAGIFAYFKYHEEPVPVTIEAVGRGHVENTITSIAAGTVMARQEARLAAGMLGTIAKVPEEGERYEEGEVLVELDHKELDAQVRLTKAHLKVGLSRLEQVKIAAEIYKEVSATRVSLTQAQLDLAQAEFARMESLAERKAVSQSNYERALAARRVAEQTRAAAEAGLKENLVRAEEIHCAETAIEQLEAAIEAAEATRDRAIVRAPFSGVVGRRFLNRGEATALGVPLLHFVNDKDCYVLAPFDEANAAELHVGQKARLNLDAYRGVDFAAEVSYIAPVISLNKGLSRTLDVKIRILEGHEKFLPGMSVDVTIIAEEKDDVVYIPSEALVREEFVYVVEGGRAVQRNVETGVGNWQYIEVLGGLQEGEQLVTSVALSNLEDGLPVIVVDELGE